MKHLIVLLASACLITSYCSAQVVDDDNNHSHDNMSHTTSRIPKIDVTFIPTDTCSLSINKVGGGLIVSGRTVNKNSPTIITLSLGNYSLLFESLETGKIIKDRSFRLTRDSVKGRTYSYPAVTFK